MILGSLDANVILRIILDDIPSQRVAAVRLLEGGMYRVADTAVVEAAFVMERNYHMQRFAIAQILVGFLAQPQVVCDQRLFAEVFPMFTAHPALSFEDCYLAAAAEQQAALPLYTFDKTLARQIAQAELVV